MRRTNKQRTNKQLPNYRASPDFWFESDFYFGLIWSLAINSIERRIYDNLQIGKILGGVGLRGVGWEGTWNQFALGGSHVSQ